MYWQTEEHNNRVRRPLQMTFYDAAATAIPFLIIVLTRLRVLTDNLVYACNPQDPPPICASRPDDGNINDRHSPRREHLLVPNGSQDLSPPRSISPHNKTQHHTMFLRRHVLGDNPNWSQTWLCPKNSSSAWNLFVFGVKRWSEVIQRREGAMPMGTFCRASNYHNC